MTERIVGFKNIYVSLSISSSLVLTAVFYNLSVANWMLVIVFIVLFLRLMINTSFCDIKDIKNDKKNNLLTLPIILGKKNLLIFLHTINLLFVIIILIGIYLKILPLFSLFLPVSSIYSFFYIYKAKNKTTDIRSISSTLVDGEFIIWPILLLLGKIAITAI